MNIRAVRQAELFLRNALSPILTSSTKLKSGDFSQAADGWHCTSNNQGIPGMQFHFGGTPTGA